MSLGPCALVKSDIAGDNRSQRDVAGKNDKVRMLTAKGSVADSRVLAR